MKTYKFRLKSTNTSILEKKAGAVDFVWNYCNEASNKSIRYNNKWLSGYDLNNLTAGCTNELGISSRTTQAVCEKYSNCLFQAKKNKLSWRSRKRSLGWVPFKGQRLTVKKDKIIYSKQTFRFWKSCEIEGKIKCGSFNQDARGRWYVSFVCESPKTPLITAGTPVGIDLGLKSIATLSNGIVLNRVNLTAKYANKLAVAQRARKKRQVANIHAKIKNSRKDWNHKETTKLINQHSKIIIGDVSPSKLKKTRMAKSVSDAGWYDFKSMLAYKASRLGVDYKEVKERFSTVTCSTCFERTGPSGLRALGVREWICKCGVLHDRDVNAAKNILRFGHESPIKGKPKASA